MSEEELEVKTLTSTERKIVLKGLKPGEEISLSNLVNKLGMDLAQVTRAVAKLEEKGVMVTGKVGRSRMVQLA